MATIDLQNPNRSELKAGVAGESQIAAPAGEKRLRDEGSPFVENAASPAAELRASAELQREDRAAGLAVSLILVSIIILGCLLIVGTVIYCL